MLVELTELRLKTMHIFLVWSLIVELFLDNFMGLCINRSEISRQVNIFHTTIIGSLQSYILIYFPIKSIAQLFQSKTG